MQMDELIDEMLAERSGEPAIGSTADSHVVTAHTKDVASDGRQVDAHRERLAALAAGGQAKQYMGKALTTGQIDELNEVEVEQLYARYEARLGAAMTKTLGQAAIQLYAVAAGRFLPIPPENQPTLVADLEADPFVSHAISSVTCELYLRYGMFLAPFTAALATVKNCQFGHHRPIANVAAESSDDGCDAESQ